MLDTAILPCECRKPNRKKRSPEEQSERGTDIPSNAACTLLLRLCVASNALAVAADDGGFVPLMVAGG